MPRWRRAAPALLLALAVLPAPSAGAAPPPPDLGGFADAIHHAQMKGGGDYARHAPTDVRAIADNLVLMQRAHGGWVQNQDPLRVFDAATRAALLAEQSAPGGSFDNRNVYTQVRYLAAAAAWLDEPAYQAAASRGLAYLLREQLPRCGGWPHTVPAAKPYQARLTVADEVFSGALGLLREIAEARPALAGFSSAEREAAQAALARGEDCLLRLQVRLPDGRLGGWAGQYDPVTLAPAGGRSFELPAMVVEETVAIVRYLASIERPSPAVVASIEGAAAWLEGIALRGVRLETVPLERTQEHPYHRAAFDRRLVADADAPLLWPRFADLADSSVVLANRDGRRVATYAEVDIERRTGYAWYGTWPAALLERELPRWRKRVAGLSAPAR